MDQKAEMALVLEHLKSAHPDGLPHKGNKTGIPSIDQYLRGFEDGSLNILAARPACGKTAFAIQTAINITKESGRKVLFYSLEMPYKEIACRMVALESGEDIGHYLATGECGSLGNITSGFDAIYKMGIHIEDRADANIMAMRNQIRRNHRPQGKSCG
ncbi:MAG: AAA family ATPase [Verrucomicrobia bacterium]|jgi:replicative DNA helicase|nr:AAA family ATPase [Verrucomicrobiota bacterium]